jgi:positive regulator of sigma E activity
LTPRARLLVVLPVIAVLVIALIYFRLFASPVIIVVIFVLYVAVSLWNRRKFRRAGKG